MTARKKRTKRQPEPIYILTASIETSAFSYYVSNHRADLSDFTDDEAILDIRGRILSTEPRQPIQPGEIIECSLICERRFRKEPRIEEPSFPFLCSLNLRGSQRSFLAYLPTDAFWAIQSQVQARALTRFEVRYPKPTRGRADPISLYLS